MLSPRAIQDQEQQAIVWAVGQMAPFVTGLLYIPLDPKEPFLTVFESCNEKLQNKLDYSTWRSKIYNKVRYIKRRSNNGKKAPWYKPYFLHLLGNTRRGLKYAKEPEDYVPPKKAAKKRKVTTESIEGGEDEEEELRKSVNRKVAKRLPVESPVSD